MTLWWSGPMPRIRRRSRRPPQAPQASPPSPPLPSAPPFAGEVHRPNPFSSEAEQVKWAEWVERAGFYSPVPQAVVKLMEALRQLGQKQEAVACEPAEKAAKREAAEREAVEREARRRRRRRRAAKRRQAAQRQVAERKATVAEDKAAERSVVERKVTEPKPQHVPQRGKARRIKMAQDEIEWARATMQKEDLDKNGRCDLDAAFAAFKARQKEHPEFKKRKPPGRSQFREQVWKPVMIEQTARTNAANDANERGNERANER